MHSDPDEVSSCYELMEHLFYRPNALYRGYSPIGTPTVVVPGLLFRAELHRQGDAGDRLEVTVFRGIQGFAAELWERSARSLIRLNALRHPGLPIIRYAQEVRELHVAFTMTEQQGAPVDPAWLGSWARESPLRAFEQFSVLLDALRLIHGARILHRGLNPAAFRLQRTGSAGADQQLSLAGFEMSMLIGNMVRRIARSDVAEARETIRAIYLGSDFPSGTLGNMGRARHFAYLPPETHEYLFEGSRHSRRDWESTDVFGLGVFGWELFCGPVADNLTIDFGRVVENLDGPATVSSLAGLHSAMRDHLRQRDEVPKPLRDAILRMIDFRPDGRKTTFELALDLENAWDSVKLTWEASEERPYLVAIMPHRSVETLYEHEGRSWLTRSPDTPLGRDELLSFMRHELSEASLVRAINGARGYATGPDATLAAAQWVLIGRRAVWFCEFLRDIHGVNDEVLLVKYLTEHQNAAELYEAIPRRQVPALDVMSFREGQSVSHLTGSRPSWRIMTESLDRTGGFGPKDLDFLKTMDFLLEYQQVGQDARIYPFEKVEQDGNQVIVRLDQNRENEWRHRSHLATAYMSDPDHRPRLGDFLETEDLGDERDGLAVELDRRIKFPAFGRDRVEATVLRVEDPNAVRLRLPGQQLAPERGWLRLSDDAGTRTQRNREIKARQALQSQPGLVQTLRSPRAFELAPHRWELRPEIRQRLRGNAPEIITNILASEPFYALQGPPGSGKTTAVAYALELYLEQVKGARVLVVAQSNFALDNIAEALMERMPDELMLREVPDNDEGRRKVAPTVQNLLLDNVSEKLTRRLEEDVDASLPPLGQADEGEEMALLREWRETLSSTRFELSDRIRAGASIVLATTSISALLLQRARSVDDVFDWVIVEEAAKAWPTEILIPLVLGSRWTLIGDHRQLGAYRRSDLEKFLLSLEEWDAPELKAVFEARHDHLRWLALFESFFAPAAAPDALVGAPTPPAAQEWQAIGRLDTLFRMHHRIAEPIRRVFYPREPRGFEDDGFWSSDLKPDMGASKEHGLVSPEEFVGRPLIWVDTDGMEDCRCQPFWSNDGEVRVIEEIVAAMRPEAAPPSDKGKGTLVVLTPYHEQRRKLAGRGLLAGRVFTVHSFQGREADRVVVSLVRDHYVDNDPRRNVGLLAQDEVINVLLSRAKTLLVLVGNFAHFAENAGPAWRAVTSIIERYGHRVHAEETEEWKQG